MFSDQEKSGTKLCSSNRHTTILKTRNSCYFLLHLFLFPFIFKLYCVRCSLVCPLTIQSVKTTMFCPNRNNIFSVELYLKACDIYKIELTNSAPPSTYQH